MMDTKLDIIENEQEISAYIEALTNENPGEGQAFCTLLLQENDEKLNANKAVSAAYARCICRFLLHKKNKSRLEGIIANNDII